MKKSVSVIFFSKNVSLFVFLVVLISGMISCVKREFSVEFADNYPIENEVKATYRAGEEVTIQLGTITEHYYCLYVNGVEQNADRDRLYTYFTFDMPSKDILIEIEEHYVDIPYETDWCGTYTAEFEENGEHYKKFIPSIHIEKTSEHYIVTMSFRTVYGEARDDVVGEDFLPVELEQMEERNYIMVFEHKLSKATGIEYKLFVELQCDTEDTLNFRYAEKEEELALKDFYKLRKVSE